MLWVVCHLETKVGTGNGLPPGEGSAAHQLVGKVMAYQGKDG